ncbi:chorismate mutase 3, chloroplastic isoform X2 [Vigna angularis]|uniref:chorismate mutase 3, chloroplastic isoform X2 n=1 Tax=Phaseolus angularis TaxID=3914 RepID=UPI00080A610C|nr:chorismate mutase 3, chloroplastic isoform X2 [Vigna angularis]XP_052724961.1 chorismate mutase 3, chloroplastic isoform X2 [Vigna angularis]XP_052724962.1 chorismate mutase 3, chloroplastic isoform X2 [Vigna angularis]
MPFFFVVIRRSLFRQEDTIIFHLLERAKYSQDSVEYENNDDLKGSIIVKKLVLQDEMLHNQLGRYKCEEENPFFPQFLVDPIRPDLQYSKVLHPCAHSININKKIWNTYFEKILPELVKARNDDESIIELVQERNDDDSGSIADCDSLCLQALSKIIHYGKFVAEAKFQEVSSKYEAAIKAKDRELLLELLTDKTEEAIVKKRVELKATIFGQVVQIDEAYNVVNPTYKIKPSFIVELFENNIIPLSKEVQVEYLLRRLD